jgi:hypothetical protein
LQNTAAKKSGKKEIIFHKERCRNLTDVDVICCVYRAQCMYCREKEKQLYHLPKSQNNCTEKPGLIRNLVTRGEVQLGGVRPSWALFRCRVDRPYPPPPQWLTFLICGESYLY